MRGARGGTQPQPKEGGFEAAALVSRPFFSLQALAAQLAPYMLADAAGELQV